MWHCSLLLVVAFPLSTPSHFQSIHFYCLIFTPLHSALPYLNSIFNQSINIHTIYVPQLKGQYAGCIILVMKAMSANNSKVNSVRRWFESGLPKIGLLNQTRVNQFADTVAIVQWDLQYQDEGENKFLDRYSLQLDGNMSILFVCVYV